MRESLLFTQEECELREQEIKDLKNEKLKLVSDAHAAKDYAVSLIKLFNHFFC